MVFQLMANNELNGIYTGYNRLKDLESGAIVTINDSMQSNYQQNIKEYQEQIRKELLNKNIVYHQLLINQPLDLALRNFLNQRNKSII
jgi:hypothetical protein